MSALTLMMSFGKETNHSKNEPLLTCAVVLLALAAGSTALARDTTSVMVGAGALRVVETPRGQRVEMDGFGQLKVPGKPLLPEQRVLLALPPGSRALSAEVSCLQQVELEGRFEVMPTPPLVPLAPGGRPGEAAVLQREWERNRLASYSSDHLYPESWGELVGSGGLRKYSYAAVSFRPLRYRAASGQVTLCRSARITVEEERPVPGGPEAKRAAALLVDTLADARAAQLFVNFPEVAPLYRAAPSSTGGLRSGYVVITSARLLDAVQDSGFLEWKTSLGHTVTTFLTTDGEIAEQPGDDLPARIRNFLRESWAEKGIRYVLLVGGVLDIPMRYCYPNPANHVRAPGDPLNQAGEVPTDYYYADLTSPDSESWDSDGDGFPGEYGDDWPDLLADVSVGRIPADDPAGVEYALRKLVRTEQDTASWKSSALHGGAMLFYENEDFSGYPRVDGATSLAAIESNLMEGWNVTRMSEQDGLAPSDFPWPPLSAAAFQSAWREGAFGVVNWAGHGWAAGAARVIWSWEDGDGVPESEEFNGEEFIGVDAALNDEHPAVVFAVSCSVGYPERNIYGRLGVELLTRPGFGAASAVVSASRSAAVSGDWVNSPGGAESLSYEFNRFMIAGPDGPEKLGDALYDSKFFCHQNFGWDHVYEFQNLFDYNLYGDPAQALAGTGFGSGAVVAEAAGDHRLLLGGAEDRVGQDGGALE